MRRRAEMKVPPAQDVSRLCSAEEVRWYISQHPNWGAMTDAVLGETFGLSAGYVGMVRSGKRPPSKAFLKAIGWESVTMYQMKSPRK